MIHFQVLAETDEWITERVILQVGQMHFETQMQWSNLLNEKLTIFVLCTFELGLRGSEHLAALRPMFLSSVWVKMSKHELKHITTTVWNRKCKCLRYHHCFLYRVISLPVFQCRWMMMTSVIFYHEMIRFERIKYSIFWICLIIQP